MGRKRGEWRKKKAERHQRKLAAGALVEVEYRGRVLHVRPAVAEFIAREANVRSAAAARELDVAVSVADVGATSTLHVQFNSWRTGGRVLDWWPGNGTWRAGGESGTETDWPAVLELAGGNSGPSGDTPEYPVCPHCGGEAGHRCRGVAGPADEWREFGDPVG